jgi:hypothetical protein
MIRKILGWEEMEIVLDGPVCLECRMSILSDIFLATPAEAPAYDGSVSSIERLQTKSLTPLELSLLRALLSGEEWEVSRINEFSEVVSSDEEWIFQFPTAFTQMLATLGEAEVETSSREWAETEELACEPGEIQPVVEELVLLARKSVASGKPLFLWMSL